MMISVMLDVGVLITHFAPKPLAGEREWRMI